MDMIAASLAAFEDHEWFRPVSAKGKKYAYTWNEFDPRDVNLNNVIRVPGWGEGTARFPLFAQLFEEWEVVDPHTVNSGK